MNCATRTSCKRTASSRPARRSNRHRVEALARDWSAPTAVCSAGSERSSSWSFRSSYPSARPKTRCRSIDRAECWQLALRRGSSRTRSAYSVNPNIRSACRSSTAPPAKRASTSRPLQRGKRTNSGLQSVMGKVSFDIGLTT